MTFSGGPFRRRRQYDPYDPYGPYGQQPPPPYQQPGPWGYGYPRRYPRSGGGSCLRDLLFLDAGCCAAEMLGCGPQLVYVLPGTLRASVTRSARDAGTGRAQRVLLGVVSAYQTQISARRPPVCRFTPTCSHFAAEALRSHGARRGTWLTVRRLLRCRPGARGGLDPVPLPR